MIQAVTPQIATALETVSRLSRATQVTKAADLFEDAVQGFGCRTYSTWLLANPERFHPSLGLISNWPAEWTEAYLRTKSYFIDPVVQNALSQPGGFHWRDLPASDRVASSELFRHARQFGLAEGFSLPIGGSATTPSIVNLSGPEPFGWTDLEQGVVSLLASTFMSRLLHLRDLALRPAVRALSRQERAVLHQAALGRPDKVIAHELNLTTRTVQSYWRNLRLKLGAEDRAHAVAIGIWSGQIAA